MSQSLQTSYSIAPASALPGQLDGSSKDVRPGKNQSGASLPFGSILVYKPSGATSDIDMASPANSTDKIAGFLHHADSYAPIWTDLNGTVQGDLDPAAGIVNGALIDVSREGRIWVKCHTGCTPGQPLFVAYSAGSTYGAAGQLGNVAEASHTIDMSAHATWDSTASADGYAWLAFDFTGH